MLLTFRGEYTRFENPEDSRIGNRAPIGGGEIRGSQIDGNGSEGMPPADGFSSFDGPMPF